MNPRTLPDVFVLCVFAVFSLPLRLSVCASQLAADQAARADRLAVVSRLKDKGNSLFKSGQYEEARRLTSRYACDVCVCVCVYVNGCMYVWCVCVYVCVCVCMCVYVCVCVCRARSCDVCGVIRRSMLYYVNRF